MQYEKQEIANALLITLAPKDSQLGHESVQLAQKTVALKSFTLFLYFDRKKMFCFHFLLSKKKIEIIQILFYVKKNLQESFNSLFFRDSWRNLIYLQQYLLFLNDESRYLEKSFSYFVKRHKLIFIYLKLFLLYQVFRYLVDFNISIPFLNFYKFHKTFVVIIIFYKRLPR